VFFSRFGYTDYNDADHRNATELFLEQGFNQCQLFRGKVEAHGEEQTRLYTSVLEAITPAVTILQEIVSEADNDAEKDLNIVLSDSESDAGDSDNSRHLVGDDDPKAKLRSALQANDIHVIASICRESLDALKQYTSSTMDAIKEAADLLEEWKGDGQFTVQQLDHHRKTLCAQLKAVGRIRIFTPHLLVERRRVEQILESASESASAYSTGFQQDAQRDEFKAALVKAKQVFIGP
jgi:hypothetical protein